MRKLTRAAIAATVLLPFACATPGAAADTPDRPAPLIRAAVPIPGEYIVSLKPGEDPAVAAGQVLGVAPKFTYSEVFRGFAAPLDPLQLEAVRKLPAVASVEEDSVVTATRASVPSWGLDRIDQRTLPLDDRFTVRGTGEGVTAYILDTGIDYGHIEFGGRAVAGYDAVRDGRAGADCHGHGTHVAGTVGGATFGVARKVSLVGVRVLGCDGQGTNSGIIAGIEWVAANAAGPAVLNGSLGGGRSEALNAAVDGLSRKGVLPVVAAGNDAVDACGISPASAERAVTVGATDQADRETDFSNFGPCLWLYAPGKAITSARLGGGSVALNGTSMAAPHVAGVAALHLATNPTADPEDTAFWLAGQSTKDVLQVSKTSPNRLLYTSGL